MGLLTMLISPASETEPADAAPLAQTIQLMASIDGKVESAELTVLEAMLKTVPQLKGHPLPARITRRELLDLLGTITDEPLRRQCFVLAVEVALASGSVNESEDQFTDMLQKALHIDLAFAREAIEVIAYKYARAR
jgi:hypothetical protein